MSDLIGQGSFLESSLFSLVTEAFSPWKGSRKALVLTHDLPNTNTFLQTTFVFLWACAPLEGVSDYQLATAYGKQCRLIRVHLRFSVRGLSGSSPVHPRCIRMCMFFRFKSLVPTLWNHVNQSIGWLVSPILLHFLAKLKRRWRKALFLTLVYFLLLLVATKRLGKSSCSPVGPSVGLSILFFSLSFLFCSSFTVVVVVVISTTE